MKKGAIGSLFLRIHYTTATFFDIVKKFT